LERYFSELLALKVEVILIMKVVAVVEAVGRLPQYLAIEVVGGSSAAVVVVVGGSSAVVVVSQSCRMEL
jgi:hypothetical protein